MGQEEYQGITHAANPHVIEAVKATRGQILTYGGDNARELIMIYG